MHPMIESRLNMKEGVLLLVKIQTHMFSAPRGVKRGWMKEVPRWLNSTHVDERALVLGSDRPPDNIWNNWSTTTSSAPILF